MAKKTAKKTTTKKTASKAKRPTAKAAASKPATKKAAAKKSTKKAAAKKPVKPSISEEEVTIDRRRVDGDVQIERREKVSRRRQIDPTTCERDYSNDEVEFMQALDDYKRKNGRMFPTCSEVLEVIRGLGYIKQDLAALEGAGEVAAETEPVAADAAIPAPIAPAPAFEAATFIDA